MADTDRRAPEAHLRDASTAERTQEERSAFNFSASRGDETIPELVGRLAEQGSRLAEQQAKLMQAEVRSSIDDVKAAAGAMAGAAVVGIASLGVLMMAAAYLLDLIMPLWLGTGIVAVAGMGVAYLMYRAGQRKLQSSSMQIERTKRTIERAPGAIAGHSQEGQHHG